MLCFSKTLLFDKPQQENSAFYIIYSKYILYISDGGFPGDTMVKNLPAKAGDTRLAGQISGLGHLQACSPLIQSWGYSKIIFSKASTWLSITFLKFVMVLKAQYTTVYSYPWISQAIPLTTTLSHSYLPATYIIFHLLEQAMLSHIFRPFKILSPSILAVLPNSILLHRIHLDSILQLYNSLYFPNIL